MRSRRIFAFDWVMRGADLTTTIYSQITDGERRLCRKFIALYDDLDHESYVERVEWFLLDWEHKPRNWQAMRDALMASAKLVANPEMATVLR